MMKKEELYKYVGNIQQLACVRPLTCEEGRGRGMRMYEVRNGALSFSLMADKCLDMAALSYRGINFSFLSKPGLQGRNSYDTAGAEAGRSIMGGFFFTAGLENICAPCERDGKAYPMHGRMRTTPAEGVSAKAEWSDGFYVLSAEGEMREAELFGENMVLRRRIETVLGEKSFTVTDEIENESFREEPMMLLYHINLGYPFLSPDLRLFLPTDRVKARDVSGTPHENRYDRMDEPKDNEPEYVFIHELRRDGDGATCALAVNEKLKLGLKLEFNTENLPYFMEWKSVASGDYVLGLEPSNSSVYGRLYHERHHNLHRLAPFAKETNTLRFTILDGEAEIQSEINNYRKRFGIEFTNGTEEDR